MRLARRLLSVVVNVMSDVVLLHFAYKVGGWSVRLDSRHGAAEHHKKHVHLTCKNLGGEYSWNIDGTRHDKRRFPLAGQKLKRAKQIAAEALGVSESLLQFVTSAPGGARIHLSSIDSSGKRKTTFSWYVRVKDELVILTAPHGLLFVMLGKE